MFEEGSYAVRVFYRENETAKIQANEFGNQLDDWNQTLGSDIFNFTCLGRKINLIELIIQNKKSYRIICKNTIRHNSLP